MNFATVTGLNIPEGHVKRILSKSDGMTLWACKGLLPSAFQQVEYIETDGNQYVDTGVLASDHNGGISYMMHCNVTAWSNTNGNNYFWGCYIDGVRSGNVYASTASETNSFIVACGASPNTIKACSLNYITIGKDFVLTLTASSLNPSKAEATLNGIAFAELNDGDTAAMPVATIHLFGCNGLPTTAKYYGKLYSFTMTAANGTPLRNFVPCYRKEDGVIGLYDTVGGAFYINQGTGAFTKGADIQ